MYDMEIEKPRSGMHLLESIKELEGRPAPVLVDLAAEPRKVPESHASALRESRLDHDLLHLDKHLAWRSAGIPRVVDRHRRPLLHKCPPSHMHVSYQARCGRKRHRYTPHIPHLNCFCSLQYLPRRTIQIFVLAIVLPVSRYTNAPEESELLAFAVS